MKTERGFTLVELLIVIIIIGVLSTMALTIYTGAQKSARTAKRLEDMNAIKNALEVYYSVNKSYPVIANSAWNSECAAWGNKASNEVIPGLVPKYMQAFPADPSMDKANSTSCYLYQSDGKDYKLLDHVIAEFGGTPAERIKAYSTQPSLLDPARDGGNEPCDLELSGNDRWAWAISTEGAYCW